MRSSEDSADDEFVFVTNREVTVQTYGAGSTPRGTGRLYRNQPRLNQPIPTTLDLDPPSGMHSACAAHPTDTTITTTTARAKATPLPPELIELLPPHLRENTIPDYSSSWSMTGAGRTPRRPHLPPPTFHGDYYNLDAFRRGASPHSFEHLAELVSSSDAFSSASDDTSSGHGHTRTSSLPLQRPCPPPPVSTNASLTAPAALGLTDSGISSGGSSSISSRSSSSKSLPRECPRTLNNRPLQSPSPRSTVVPHRSTATHGVVGSASHASRFANSIVSSSNEGRGRLLTRTPSPSPVLTPARAVNGHHEATHTQPTVCHAHRHTGEGDRWRQPHLNGVNSTTHGSAFVPTSSHKLIHTPAPGAGVHLARDDSLNRVVVSTGSGVAFYNAHRKASPSPTRAPPVCCTPPAEAPCRHVRPSPPPSPEMRRAWNVIGVPVSSGHHSGRNSPARSISPTSSGRLTNHGLGASRSDPNAIYDNIRVLQPSSLSQHPHAPPPCRATHSPTMGKPPSPPQQRRASRSPSPVQGWVVSRPGSPHCAPCHHAPHVQHGGCWIPVWGSSPQLYPDGGSHYCPGYVYSTPPCAGMCGVRSHSCDRLPSQPSPPPSPVCGRRSPSPWRGGSAPPVNHRHSPSPDRTSGRPPRPRRPAHRKAKTIEVGHIGSASPIPAPAGRATSPMGPTPLYMPASAILSASQSHLGTAQAAGNYGDRGHYGPSSREASPLYQNLRGDYEDVTQAGHGGGVWAAAPTAAAPPHPRSPSGADKQELKNDSKPKVTYKTTFYKCMKNLLKPTQ